MMVGNGHSGQGAATAAQPLPVAYEQDVLRAVFALSDDLCPAFDGMIAEKTPIDLALPQSGKKISLSFDPASASLIVTEQTAGDGARWRWRPLQQLILRSLIKSKTGQDHSDFAAQFPHLHAAMQYLRPTMPMGAMSPALAQLHSRCLDQLAQSETVTFHASATHLFGVMQAVDDSQRHAALSDYLEGLSREMQIVMAQDELVNASEHLNNPTVFLPSECDKLIPLAHQANAPARNNVSLVIPAEVQLKVGVGAVATYRAVATTLVYLDLSPAAVMEILRVHTPTTPAVDVLALNGLSLDGLVTRESRMNQLRPE